MNQEKTDLAAFSNDLETFAKAMDSNDGDALNTHLEAVFGSKRASAAGHLLVMDKMLRRKYRIESLFSFFFGVSVTLVITWILS